MTYFPININLKHQNILVIGGGYVAERKVSSILQYGNSVTVVAPNVTNRLYKLWKSGKISYIERKYRKGDLKDFDLVFSATNNVSVSRDIYREAKESQVLVNTADTPEYCDFTIPAIVKQGDLIIAVSTNGECPALSKKIKVELEKLFPQEYSKLVALLGQIRRRCLENKDQFPTPYPELLETFLLDLENIIKWIRKGEMSNIEKLIDHIFGFRIEIKKIMD